MITYMAKGYKVVESPILLDLTDELKTGKWTLLELRLGRINRMKIKRKKKY